MGAESKHSVSYTNELTDRGNMLKQFKNRSNQSGFTIIELLMVMVLIAIMLPGLFIYLQISNERMLQKATAGYMEQLGNAVKEYVLDNYSTLTASSTASVSTSIPLSTLTAGNYLPATFGAQNPYKQDYQIYILEPSANDLLAIILTANGQMYDAANPKFGTQTIPKAAAMIGAGGGYIPTGIIATEPNTIIQGVFGGWKFTFAGTDVPNPGAAHLAYQKYFVDGTAENDYLYRNAVPGRPDLNMMATNLDMDGHTILMGDGDLGGGDTEGVGRVNFEEHSEGDFPCTPGDDNSGALYYDNTKGLLLCRNGTLYRVNDSGNTGSFQSSMIVADGMVIPKPTNCPTNLPNPQIFFAMAMASENNIFRPLQGIQTWAIDNGASWTAHIRVQANGSWFTPNSNYGRILSILTCAP